MKLKITVHGVAYEVDVEVLEANEGFPGATGALPLPLPLPLGPGAGPATHAPAPTSWNPPASGPATPDGVRSIASPVAGTVLEIKCKKGDLLEENQVAFVLETMKMKTFIASPAKGRVAEVLVGVGDAVKETQSLLSYE